MSFLDRYKDEGWKTKMTDSQKVTKAAEIIRKEHPDIDVYEAISLAFKIVEAIKE